MRKSVSIDSSRNIEVTVAVKIEAFSLELVCLSASVGVLDLLSIDESCVKSMLEHIDGVVHLCTESKLVFVF